MTSVTSPPVSPAAPDLAPRLQALRERYDSPLVKAQTLKLMLDGTELNHTAFLLEPYCDKPHSCGSTTMPEEVFEGHVRKADALGIDVMVHAVGDAAVRMALDVFERTFSSNPPRDRRHVITHAFLTHPDDIPRFRRIGVMANTQLQWGVVDAYAEAIEVAETEGAPLEPEFCRDRAHPVFAASGQDGGEAPVPGHARGQRKPRPCRYRRDRCSPGHPNRLVPGRGTRLHRWHHERPDHPDPPLSRA